MKTIDITSLPKIKFAHTYEAEQYEKLLPVFPAHIEISYITKGSLEINTGEQTYVAHEGDILCLFRDQELLVRATRPHCHHTFCAKLEWNTFANNMNSLYLPVLTKFSPQSEEIHQTIDEIIYHPHQYEGSIAKQTSLVMNVLCKIDACYRKSESYKLPSDVWLAERAKKYIHKHMSEPISQSDVAAYLKITPTHLCRIFKKTQGISFMKYVNKTKLENMKNLMEHENLHIYEVAELFGYNDPNYVSYLHKKIFGYNITDKASVD